VSALEWLGVSCQALIRLALVLDLIGLVHRVYLQMEGVLTLRVHEHVLSEIVAAEL
jgi:hypothetical protein